MNTERRRWWGWIVILVGIATPIIALIIYFNRCPRQPCGLGGPGTCMFFHLSCDLNPGYVWFWSSLGAVALIIIGASMGRAARVEMRQECVRCGHRKAVHLIDEPACNVPDCLCQLFLARTASADEH